MRVLHIELSCNLGVSSSIRAVLQQQILKSSVTIYDRDSGKWENAFSLTTDTRSSENSKNLRFTNPEKSELEKYVKGTNFMLRFSKFSRFVKTPSSMINGFTPEHLFIQIIFILSVKPSNVPNVIFSKRLSFKNNLVKLTKSLKLPSSMVLIRFSCSCSSFRFPSM